MVRDKSVFPMLHSNPTRVWDTFAEPNNLNNTECSFHAKSGLITPYGVTSPKKQVNRRRLRMTAAQNLSFMGFRNTSPNPVGFFYFVAFSHGWTVLCYPFKLPPQNLQKIASASCPSFRQCGQTWVVIVSLCFWKTISAETIPVGTAI